MHSPAERRAARADVKSAAWGRRRQHARDGDAVFPVPDILLLGSGIIVLDLPVGHHEPAGLCGRLAGRAVAGVQPWPRSQ